MRTLVIETATEACSVALFGRDSGGLKLVADRHEVLGRGHAEHLVPMIAGLPDRGKAQAIFVSLGPGSFTGLRIGIAAAKALAVAWDAVAKGYPTLALVAAGSERVEDEPATVCMNGGHGEWFVQNFGSGLFPQDHPQSVKPERAAEICRHSIIVGNRAEELNALVERDAHAANSLPHARFFDRLDETHYLNDVAPFYGRQPDAKLPE